MTNNLVTFNFQNNDLRTEIKDGEPWFCLTDACKNLSIADVKNASKRLDEKGKRFSPTLTNGGVQELTFINEPNLYRLIFRSNKPQAQAFADWVYSEVLPSIRKTGSYIANTEAPVEVSPYTRRLPSGKKEIVLSEKARSEIGGIVKACCGVAIREALSGLIKAYENETPVKTEWPAEADQSLKGVAEAIVDYGRSEYSRGKIEGILKATFDENYQQMGKRMSIRTA